MLRMGRSAEICANMFFALTPTSNFLSKKGLTDDDLETRCRRETDKLENFLTSVRRLFSSRRRRNSPKVQVEFAISRRLADQKAVTG
jgi:hypothetical protein